MAKSSGDIHLCRFCGDCGPLLQSFLSLVFLWKDLQILIEIYFSPNARCVIRNPDHLYRLYLLDLVPEDAGDEDSIRLKRETASAISSCGYIFRLLIRSSSEDTGYLAQPWKPLPITKLFSDSYEIL
jgi:hypothetical protein